MRRAISAPRPVESSHRFTAVDALKGVADGISSIPDDEIPGVIAEAARLQAVLSLALAARSHAAMLASLDQAIGTRDPKLSEPAALDHEQLVDTPEAARRLNVTEDWIRRHTDELPFTVRLGRKVRFRVAGIDRYVRLQESR